MLSNLRIKNYVLIDDLSIPFNGGLTIVSGETGAGKSILLGAMSLLFGERADSKAVMNPKQKCIVEGEFDISEYGLELFFQKHELDFWSSCIIRREINSEGKSRAFINDTPVNLSTLKELSSFLVDIHSQHETLTLSESTFQMNLLDAVAGNEDILSEYKKLFADYKKTEQQLSALHRERAEFQKQKEYNQFLFDELEEVQLNEGILEKTESELQMLNNAENIKSTLSQISSLLGESEVNAISMLGSVIQQLKNISQFHSSLDDIHKRVNSLQIEMEDVLDEIRKVDDSIEYDQERIEQLTEIANQINRLLNKHQVQQVKDLIEIKEQLQQGLFQDSYNEEKINKLQKQFNELQQELITRALQLSNKRKKAIGSLESNIEQLLKDVNMPDARFKVQLMQLDDQEINSTGLNRVQFLFNANRGEHNKLQSIAQVASGGELSRLMLCIKSIYANVAQLPLIIFDEIDSGISGESAAKVAGIIDEIGKKRQVITITHLPQMAGKGANHIVVFKENNRGQTYTKLKVLSSEERVEEIARMISGDKTTDASRSNARELLSH